MVLAGPLDFNPLVCVTLKSERKKQMYNYYLDL